MEISICQDLDKDFSLATDIDEYLKQYTESDEKTQQAVRLENILLSMNVEGLVELWNKESIEAMKAYCEKRLAEANNPQLKVRYGWDLWAITGKTDYRLLQETIDRTLETLETFLEKDDPDHAVAFCDYIKKVYPHRGSLGRKQTERLINLINQALQSNNKELRFHILATVYNDAQDGNEYLQKCIGVKKLAETGLRIINEETETGIERLLEITVFFADKANDHNLTKKANELFGDYKMTHLYPDDEKNIIIAHYNDQILIDAMTCYKKAGNREKLKTATLAYEANKPKLRYIRMTSGISVERRNKEIDALNQYIMDVIKSGTPAILEVLFGNGMEVFTPAEVLIKAANEGGKELLYQTCMGSVQKDAFQNSRHTTHEKESLHRMADMAYRNSTFLVYALIICNGLHDGTFSFEFLKEAMLKRGFDKEVKVYDADGKAVGSTYFERVDIGIKDFLVLLPESIQGNAVDWRYCITFLTTQFEGLFRDVLYKNGIPIDRVKKEGDTELIPLEGLLKDDQTKELFSDDDLMLFSQTFTKDGYNIRNHVAHGMYLPQEYTNRIAMLVFLCVLRLTKATEKLVSA